jgi:hypothetical protein
VGVLLWELVSGRRYDGAALGVPPLQTIVRQATAVDPAARFADAAAMLAAVSRFLRSATGAMTQAELGALVRQRAPDVLVARADEDGDGNGGGEPGGDEDAPAGPRTVAVPRGRQQVTFATRIGGMPAAGGAWRRRALLGAGGLALLGLAALAGARLRGATSPLPLPALPRTARLDLRAVPPDAVLTVDGKPVAAGAIELPPGRHRIAASAPGRAPASRDIVLGAGGAAVETLALEPSPVHLVVRSDPPGAEVVIADRVVGTTPFDARLPLEPGARLKLRKRDFVTVERPLTVAGGAAELDARMQPIARGELTLGALPWAHVTIDGEKRPDTPLSKVPLGAGPHQVRLSCPPTGRELKFTVQIEAGKETRKVADLRADPRLVE